MPGISEQKRDGRVERPSRGDHCRDSLPPLIISYGRWASSGTLRRAEPMYSWRGRPILYSGSVIISSHWVIQPTVRARAKMHVNIEVGIPMAFWTIPE